MAAKRTKTETKRTKTETPVEPQACGSCGASTTGHNCPECGEQIK